MPKSVTEFFRASIKNGLIVDANLFLLLAFELDHKRTEDLGGELEVLQAITSYCVDQGGRLILTPHIIAEVSNMLINRGKKFDLSGDSKFARLTRFVALAAEKHISKELILDNKHLAYLGFTDLSIMEAAKEDGFGVLTLDNELYCKLTDEECLVVNPRVIAEAKALRRLLSI